MNTTLVFSSLFICFFLMLTVSRADQKSDAELKAIVPPPSFAALYGHDAFRDQSDEHEFEKRRFNAWAGKRSRLTKRRFNAWAGR